MLEMQETWVQFLGLEDPLAEEMAEVTAAAKPLQSCPNLSPHREFPPATAREVDPLRIQPQHPHTSRQPTW